MVRKGLKSDAVTREEVTKSKNLFNAFRDAAKKVDDYLNQRIEEYTDSENRVNTIREGLLLGLSALAIGSALIATRVARRESRLQEEATRTAVAERRRLQTIVENLP